MVPPEDLVLTAPWVEALRAVIRSRIGYEIPEHRMVREIVPFVLRRTESAGQTEPAAYVAALEAATSGEDWSELVEAVTVGETYFYRHPTQVEAIVSRLRRTHARHGHPVRIWSAGCATGEEPYTLAMRLRADGVPFEILASDVNESALGRARAADSYRDRAVAHLPEQLRQRWLVPAGPRRWRVAHARDLGVTFVRHNVVADAHLRPDGGGWDAVLCRNVIIYFPPDARRHVVTALGRTLADDGTLWLAPCDHLRLEGAEGLAWDREGDERYLRSRRADEKVRTIPAAIVPSAPRSDPDPEPAPRDEFDLQRVGRLLDDGLVVTARDTLQTRTNDHPEDGATWVALAACRIAEHAFDDALLALERAAATRPKPEGLEYFRGTALFKAGRLQDARAAFHAAIRDDPDDWASSYQVAALYRRSGRTLHEELMLERTAGLLAAENARTPSFGIASGVVSGVHGDPAEARRIVRSRLATLAGDRGG